MSIQVKKILVPIDFSEYSKSALKYATSFAEIFHSELVLIYVIEPVIYPPDFSMGQISIPAVDLEMDKRAKEELEKLAQTEFNSSIKVTTMVKTGKPFVEIIETAKEEEVDLIIISSHGHSGVEQILFGSTAEKVVRKSTCPVLTIRRESKVNNS